ncbi:hypothetical protein B0T25DRAFT_462354 [Lasiosphaeria hispida]|uniref:Uncharacterized protein n=1 Tax=Lasiosphaeria hispida TaxID=260671 RepID=A0AAJ0MB19_9PEZI|nr:hypothetical protein B0T25DRAFT_462354 [Lasiosphaeria hispida]
MSAALPDDLALSTTYIPHMRKVYCVIFGCNSAQMQAVEKRIRAAGDGTDHPLLVTGILAEIERERLINMAEDLVDQFTLGSDVLETKSWDPNSPKLQHYLAICFQSGGLADQIRAVKRQIVKLIAEVETLEREWTGNHDSTNYCQRSGNFILEQQPLLDTGQRIKQRLQDIMNEYDDKIDECKMMAHNLSLAMQSASNKNARQDSVTNIRIAKANTIIALETKRESAQMRSIALLTMIYLPMSCVASIFSTSLFNWRPDEGEAVVSHYIWVLLVLSVGLTVITVLAWHFTTNREKKRENKRSQSFDINLEDMV